MPAREECKRILSKLGFKLGVSPALISTRLLSIDNKTDMLNGDLTTDVLECHVDVWMANGMPDYANGNVEPMNSNFYK